MKIPGFYLLNLSLAVPSAQGYEVDEIPTGGPPLRLTFFGHASLMVELGSFVVQVDPVMAEADYSRQPKADLILITHEHGDHLDATAIKNLTKPGTVIILNKAVHERLGSGHPLSNGEKYQGASFSVEALPAYNQSQDRLKFHPKGRDNGYILTLGGKRIYLAGDTEDTPEMRALKNIDIAFLPMNLPYTMTPEQVAAAARAFRPGLLYPYHFGETDPRRLVDLLGDDPGIEVRVRQMQ